jgi:hypothetical protein
MNKLIVVFSVMLILLCSSVMAVDSNKLHLSQVSVYTFDYGITGLVSIENTLGTSLKNLHVTMMIPELGLQTSTSSFRLSGHGETVKQLLLDSDSIAPGDYYVKVTVSNNDVKKTKYRIITIE